MKVPFTRQAGSFGGRTSSRRLIPAALITMSIAALLSVFLAGTASADDDDGGEYVSRQVVVKLTPEAKIGTVNRRYGTTTISRLPGMEKIYLLKTPRGTDPATLARRMTRDSRVVYAEPNFEAGLPEARRRHRAFPGGIPGPSLDPIPYRDQYAVEALNLAEAHDINSGEGSVVAVIDTGVQSGHPELSERLVAGYDFVGGDNNPADAGNGRDDDLDGEKDEMVGHGTHVAGTVALAAPEAKIMPVRVLDSEGRGTIFGIAKGIRFSVRNGADVVNLSLGSSRESDLLEDLIGDDDDDDSSARAAVFVAAAGNDYNSVAQYPAAEDGAIAVTSVDQDMKKSDFANYGPWVTIAAPGSDIYSPFPTDRYASWSGTSMATPFVAAQAALVRSIRPSASPACVTGIIGTTAQDLHALNPTYAGELGSGQADVRASTEYAAGSNPCFVEDD